MGWRVFWTWFAGGALAVVLKAEFLFGSVPVVNWVLELLTAPGTFVLLVVMNSFASGWQVLAAVAAANGLIYGVVAVFISRRRTRQG